MDDFIQISVLKRDGDTAVGEVLQFISIMEYDELLSELGMDEIRIRDWIRNVGPDANVSNTGTVICPMYPALSRIIFSYVDPIIFSEDDIRSLRREAKRLLNKSGGNVFQKIVSSVEIAASRGALLHIGHP